MPGVLYSDCCEAKLPLGATRGCSRARRLSVGHHVDTDVSAGMLSFTFTEASKTFWKLYVLELALAFSP